MPQIRRGLLAQLDAPTPGSPWWRAVNERLLYDGWEAMGLAVGIPGEPSGPSVAAALAELQQGGVPVYGWPIHDSEPWRPKPSPFVRAVRKGIPAPRRGQVASPRPCSAGPL